MVKQFLTSCHSADHPQLLPDQNILESVGGPLVYSIAEHKEDLLDTLNVFQGGKRAITCKLYMLICLKLQPFF